MCFVVCVDVCVFSFTTGTVLAADSVDLKLRVGVLWGLKGVLISASVSVCFLCRCLCFSEHVDVPVRVYAPL